MAIKGFFGEHRFLSNFWPCNVALFGQLYPSVEHAYQAAKSADGDYRQVIMAAQTAAIAKRLGKKAVLRDDWEEKKLEFMAELVSLKFRNGDLKDRLLATGDEYLEETNRWGDTFWGVCGGKGYNHLGLILMKVRCALSML